VRVAHTLTGSCGNLGATVLAELCAALVEDCRSGDVGAAQAGLELVEREYARVAPAVRALVTR
jgi:HPt (histidine-containing phosphotransfer) domain-containing protein